MRLPLLPVLIMLIIGVITDIYIYRRMRHAACRRGWCIAYATSAILAGLMLLWVTVMPKRSGDDVALRSLMWMLYAYLTIYLPRYIYVLASLLRRGLHRLWPRWRFRPVTWLATALGVIVFGGMWWGALFDKYMIDVRRVDVEIPHLPAAFKGYTIAQISDMHLGTYGSDTTFVARLVDSVNSLHPDLIVFTGDLVNRHSQEAIPFIHTLSRLTAPDGVWAVMGNHDYGDYYNWPDESAHRADIAQMRKIRLDMGWHNLDNNHTWLRHGQDSIALIGVENIGDPPFHVYGNLSKAYPNVDDSAVKILLSHNPSHWNDSIAEKCDANIALTLSGHTHAMQIEILGWSPAAWRYATWGGLYSDSMGHQLYVNIGTGEVAMPARIGATPEITLITLK